MTARRKSSRAMAQPPRGWISPPPINGNYSNLDYRILCDSGADWMMWLFPNDGPQFCDGLIFAGAEVVGPNSKVGKQKRKKKASK